MFCNYGSCPLYDELNFIFAFARLAKSPCILLRPADLFKTSFPLISWQNHATIVKQILQLS